jgi:hypothetical protein
MGEPNRIEKAIAAVEFLVEFVADVEKHAGDVLYEVAETLKSVGVMLPEEGNETSIPDAIWDRVEEFGTLTSRLSLVHGMIDSCRRSIEKRLNLLRSMTEYSETAAGLVRIALEETRRAYELGNDFNALASRARDVAADVIAKLKEIHSRTGLLN